MPESTYFLNVYNSAGALQYVVEDLLQLSYTKAVNAPGLLQFAIDAVHDSGRCLTRREQAVPAGDIVALQSRFIERRHFRHRRRAPRRGHADGL